LKADSKFRQAQFNCFGAIEEKRLCRARDRFEALLSKTPAETKRTAQLIKFDIYMTWLLEAKTVVLRS